MSRPPELKQLEEDILAFEKKKNDAIHEQKFEKKRTTVHVREEMMINLKIAQSLVIKKMII